MINTGAIYENRKNGKQVEVINFNADTLMVTVVFANDKTAEYLESNFKKSYKKIADVQTVEEKEDNTESEQITVDFTKDTFIEYIKQVLVKYGYTLKLWEKLPNIVAFKLGNKTVGEIAVGKTSYRINTKAVYAEGIDVEFTTINNYYLPAAVKKIPFTDNMVIRLLDHIVKNTNNSKKG